jgi:hypothetical protein
MGCGSTTEPSCDASSAGTVTVTGGLVPTFSWTADCPATYLAVFDPVTGDAYWEVRASKNVIRKPATYGMVPTGTTQLHAPALLHSGGNYAVYISILAGGDTLRAVASFTP